MATRPLIIVTMQTNRPALAMVAALLTCLAAGCVSAGRIDHNLLYQYDQWTLHKGPPPRLDELRPKPDSGITLLKVQTDPKTGERSAELSLQDAIYLALANSLEIKVLAYDPAISWLDVEQAAGAFDPVLFGSGSDTLTDARSTSTFGGTQTKNLTGQLGVRQHWETGADLKAAYNVSRQTTDNGSLTTFNPAYSQDFSVQLTQPLLRGAGRDFNLGDLRVARANYKVTLHQFRGKVLQVLIKVQTLYWQLVQARAALDIQEELLRRTEETLQKVIARGELDANKVQITQAQAAVESTRATLIEARKTIRDTEDDLIRVLGDSRASLLSDMRIIPTTPPSRVDVSLDATDQIITALKYNPDLAQARMAIAIADIKLGVARNKELPVLTFQVGASPNGVAGTYSDSWGVLRDANFINYTIGLQFEYPLGNRTPRAARKQAEFQRTQSIVTMQDVADQVGVAVKQAVRGVSTAAAEIQAQSAALKASRENLQAIEDRETYGTAALTPEFLQSQAPGPADPRPDRERRTPGRDELQRRPDQPGGPDRRAGGDGRREDRRRRRGPRPPAGQSHRHAALGLGQPRARPGIGAGGDAQAVE